MKIQMIPLLITISLLITGNTQADIFGTGANQFSIDFVNIGYAGNAADTFTGFGSVGYGAVNYDYRIGKYEITIDQFTKARATDNRIGNGNEDYWNSGTRSGGVDAPAGSVTWYEGAMFCNWLTTGNAYAGAYQFNGSGTLLAVDRAAAVAAYGTVYILPTEDEWYKAAYYKPVDDGSYSLFSSGLNSVPIKGASTGWNYEGALAGNSPDFIWVGGSGAEEQNGTYDMMGNDHEWTESSEDGVLDDMAEDRVIRGGHFADFAEGIGAAERFTPPPQGEAQTFGFRVAVIPEPSSVLLMMVGAGGLLFHRRARQRVQHNQPPTRRLWK